MNAPTATARWFRRFHQTGRPSARLVCFPHAGGTAGYYHPFSAALSTACPAAEVVAAQYPGRQDRFGEPGIDSIAELADQLHQALRPYAGDGLPLTFFGHSMGAVLAFEVARRFEEDELPGPVHLFLSGRRAPSHPDADEEQVYLLPDDSLLAHMAELGGTDLRVLADPELRSVILPSVRSDYTAVETYHAEPGATVTRPITVLTGDADPRVSVEEARDWAGHTTAGFDLRVFPGGHFYLVEQVPALTALLAAHLTASAAGAADAAGARGAAARRVFS